MGGDDLTGRINGWRCEKSPFHPDGPACGRITYAVHVHHGVTPMFLACRAAGLEPDDPANECKGQGVSLMYPDADPPAHVVAVVAWEWYRPDAAEMKRLRKKARRGDHQAAGLLDHVEKGGLDLRPLTDAGREFLAAIA